MDTQQILKKKCSLKTSSKKDGPVKPDKPKILLTIALSNGSQVDISKPILDISQLTSFDNMAIAQGLAALAISCVNQLGLKATPPLADNYNLAPIRMHLEDLMNHIYFAIENYPKNKEQC